MPIRITDAKTPKQIDDVFKLRHEVFCEEGGYFKLRPDERFLDRFDAYPTTTNLIVVVAGKVVGNMRLTLDSTMGIPADDFYDFRSHLPPDAVVMNSGMYCVTKEFRNSRIALGIILMATYFGVQNKVTHVVAPINPPIANLVKRIGFKILGDELVEAHTGVTILPAMLDLRDLNDFFSQFAQKHQLQDFLSVYDCVFYKPGEYLTKTGEKGDCAFVIVEGEAEIKINNKVVSTLKEGEVIGELALLTDEVRSADVVAKSDMRVMTLDKSIFMEYLLTNPEKVIDMMKTMGTRMKNLSIYV